jgi:pyrroloquinoline quinone biosynthesis protein B
MVVRVLGSAAGGGVPQWNCGCRQCAAARTRTIEKRTQCSIAVSVDRARWILVNASPDLRSQLLCFPVQPCDGRRETPIEAVLLTDADLDHVLGLFLLREDNLEVMIHTSKAIRKSIEDGLGLTEILGSYCGVQWVEAPHEFSGLFCRDGADSGLEYKAIEIDGQCPKYQRKMTPSGQTCPRLVYVFREPDKDRHVLIAPGVVNMETQLLTELSEAHAVFFDGTCWSRDDFKKSGIANVLGPELWQSHLPISDGSLRALAEIRAKHRVYLHINNTNPILRRDSPERKQLDESGIGVATDGMEFEV